MVKKSGIVTILSTTTREQAPVLAKSLVGQRLVACVTIMPVRSVYRWRENVVDEDESLMIMKTREENADTVIATIKREHSYEVPEILVLPVVQGHAPYLDWIRQETKRS